MRLLKALWWIIRLLYFIVVSIPIGIMLYALIELTYFFLSIIRFIKKNQKND